MKDLKLLIPLQEFKRLLEQTIYATGKQLKKYDLSCIRVKTYRGEIQFCATDGARIAQSFYVDHGFPLSLQDKKREFLLSAKELKKIYNKIEKAETTIEGFFGSMVEITVSIKNTIIKIAEKNFCLEKTLINKHKKFFPKIEDSFPDFANCEDYHCFQTTRDTLALHTYLLEADYVFGIKKQMKKEFAKQSRQITITLNGQKLTLSINLEKNYTDNKVPITSSNKRVVFRTSFNLKDFKYNARVEKKISMDFLQDVLVSQEFHGDILYCWISTKEKDPFILQEIREKDGHRETLSLAIIKPIVKETK